MSNCNVIILINVGWFIVLMFTTVYQCKIKMLVDWIVVSDENRKKKSIFLTIATVSVWGSTKMCRHNIILCTVDCCETIYW